MRGKKKLIGVAVLGLVALALVATAGAQKLQAGNILVYAEGGFAPQKLPKHENAPITIHGGGRITTVSGELPPILETIELEYDKHGAVDTVGLAVCKKHQLEARTVQGARAACPKAIVGEGSGSAIVVLPESKPIKATSPITLFNGPKKHGYPTVYAHAYLSKPVPTTFIVPVVIESISKGLYGYRTKATIPPIVNGYGTPVKGSLKIGKKWTYKGKKHSYISARCETGRLQARGQFTFKDDTILSGTFLRQCTVRH